MAYDAVRLQNLAALVTARRTAIGISLDEAARRAVDAEGKPMSNTTWKRVEKGLPTRDTTYARVDQVLGWVPGSCMEILNGSTAAPAVSSVAADGVRITELADLEESLSAAIQSATIATAPDLTGGQIRELNDRVLADLRKRGVLPGQ
jgi:hypothetical protein